MSTTTNRFDFLVIYKFPEVFSTNELHSVFIASSQFFSFFASSVDLGITLSFINSFKNATGFTSASCSKRVCLELNELLLKIFCSLKNTILDFLALKVPLNVPIRYVLLLSDDPKNILFCEVRFIFFGMISQYERKQYNQTFLVILNLVSVQILLQVVFF